jgi:hypothetical protein
MCHPIPEYQPHPLKALLLPHLKLWQIRRMLGGRPSEGKPSRCLNGIEVLPPDLEHRLEALIDGLTIDCATTLTAKRASS